MAEPWTDCPQCPACGAPCGIAPKWAPSVHSLVCAVCAHSWPGSAAEVEKATLGCAALRARWRKDWCRRG